jgi:glycosyltransferase involved in cell wall biosynthesis
MQIELINDQPEYSGTGVYAWNLYQNLKDDPAIRFVHYNSSRASCDFWESGKVNISLQVKRAVAKPLFWRNCSKSYQHAENIHILSQNLSFLNFGKKRIITCLDLIPLIMPGTIGEKYWRRFLYSGLKKADHIISISQATKDDLVKIYRIDPAKITPIMLGVSPEFRPRDKADCRKELELSGSDKWVLHVGTPAPRKNFITVLRAFKSISGSTGVKLVKVGRISEVEQRFISQNDLNESVIVREHVGKNDLPLYYAGADVLAFPSLYEGFGLPVLEAMASGCPVITSNTTSLPEVAGDAGILIDPKDWFGLSKKMTEVIQSRELAEKCRENGIEKAKLFTWKKTAINTKKVYDMVYK